MNKPCDENCLVLPMCSEPCEDFENYILTRFENKGVFIKPFQVRQVSKFMLLSKGSNGVPRLTLRSVWIQRKEDNNYYFLDCANMYIFFQNGNIREAYYYRNNSSIEPRIGYNI
jgi:hypothetical protein